MQCSFDERIFDKIVFLKEHHPHVKIAVDGGINAGIAGRLKELGTDGIVVGSAIFSAGDPKRALEEFKTDLG